MGRHIKTAPYDKPQSKTIFLFKILLKFTVCMLCEGKTLWLIRMRADYERARAHLFEERAVQTLTRSF